MVAQVVEYVLGKDGVPGSSPGLSSFQTLLLITLSEEAYFLTNNF